MAIDKYSPEFIQWAEVWVKGNYFPVALAPVVVAQAANETGCGYSKLFLDHRNFAGLKWRGELSKVNGAKPVLIQVPSEPHPVKFTSFNSWEAACEGYVAFVNRSIYRGWDRCRTPRQYLDHLQGYRNGRKTASAFCAWNGYQDRVLKLLPDAEQIANRVLSNPRETRITAASKRRICIDIGHNAPPRDTGAVGVIKEDIWTKSIGLALADIIRGQGHEVMLPKVSGKSLNSSLQGRVAAANRSNVDTFVSLHLNAAGSSKATGTEVYVSKSCSRKSRELARGVQSELVSLLNLRDRGVKAYDFYVLRATNMPAILVEVGFVTNSGDSRRIEEVGAKAIATSISKGLAIIPQAVQSFTPQLSVQPAFGEKFLIENMIRYHQGFPWQKEAINQLQQLLEANPTVMEKVTNTWRQHD